MQCDDYTIGLRAQERGANLGDSCKTLRFALTLPLYVKLITIRMKKHTYGKPQYLKYISRLYNRTCKFS